MRASTFICPPRTPRWRWLFRSRRCLGWVAVPMVAAASWLVAVADTAPTIKPVNLATTPLYANGAAAQKPTLTLALSVEFPTTGAAYRASKGATDDATYTETSNYLGYFDHASCYTYQLNPDGTGIFVRAGAAAAATHRCSDQYSGNFMNWASASSIDILRRALTGGDRITDSANQTVLQRAYLQDDFFYSNSYFPGKSVPLTVAQGALPSNVRNPSGDTWIGNCQNKIFFNNGTQKAGTCPTIGGMLVRVQVCDSSGGQLTDSRPDLCLRYPNGQFKPVGAIQKYSDNVRLAAFGYLNDTTSGDRRYGGVLRAPMKWVGPKAYDKDGVPTLGLNPNREWDVDTGIFFQNPDGHSMGISGVINYLNQFGRLGSSPGTYKSNDPVGELYYEALRYLQGLPPTPEAVSGLTDTLKGGFPVYDDWAGLDPYKDGASTGDYSCIRNNIFAVGDVYTHADWSVPGNTQTKNYDFVRPANPNHNEPDFIQWTNLVGAFETNDGTATYPYTPPSTDGGVTQPATVTATVGNPNAKTLSPLPGAALSNLGSLPTGSGQSASYLIAGMAFWANTHDIRGKNWTSGLDKQRPGMRARTYVLDVNESASSSDPSFRRNTQYFLAAKYGGFADQSGKGNPFLDKNQQLDNTIWSDSTNGLGDAKNYFLSSSADKVIAAVNEIFAGTAAEGNSIAGAALSSDTVSSSGQTIRFFNTRFDGSDWSGDVVARPLATNADGSVSLGSENSAQAWDAERQLEQMTPAQRNIVIGNRDDQSALSASPLPTQWRALPSQFRQQMSQGLLEGLLGLVGNPLNEGVAGNLVCDPSSCQPTADQKAIEEVGNMQLAFLRGSTTYNNQPLGGRTTPPIAGKDYIIRARSRILGDIVNSAVVYSGTPARGIVDPGYADFYKAHQDRAGTVFVGANDGMLHAFDADAGTERFAYIPSWMAPNLAALTDSRYGASSATPHQAYVDAPPTVGEAKVGNDWKTVLVSGTGAGGQGVFALDVTAPASFTKDQVLWEFTDKDEPSLGHVVGKPQLQKFKTGTDASGHAVYKWFAVVASGVNNYVQDGSVSGSADQALFLLDLGKTPGDKWAMGTNYFKLTLPADSTLSANVAPGIVDFSATGGTANDVAQIYVGDLHGRLWKIDYATQLAVSKTIDATITALNKSTGIENKPLFKTARTTVKDPASGRSITVPQAISTAPALVAGPPVTPGFQSVVVMFGTGKYLEDSDNYLSASAPKQSIYAVLDAGDSPVKSTLDQSSLVQGQVSADGKAVSVASFRWGPLSKDAKGNAVQKPGWYFNFGSPAILGERQLSRLVTFGNSVNFNSLMPPGGATNPCATTGSQSYSLDFSSGAGSMQVSQAGNLSMPFMLMASGALGPVSSTGSGQATVTARTISVGAKGVPSPQKLDANADAGQLSWRLIENYRQLKADALKKQGNAP